MAKNQDASQARSTFVRHGKLRRSNAWGNGLRVLLTALLVVALSGAATVAYAVWGLVSDVRTVNLAGGNNADAVGVGDASIDGALTVLLVGSDTREGQKYQDGVEGELNDVNLMLHVAEDHKSATVVSFPRDLKVPFPSCPGPNGEPDYTSPMSEQQINAAMSVGGLPCVARVIEELTGMEIPYAGLVTFDGVIGISNALGGVDVCLAQPIVDEYTDLDLPAGEVTLKGNEALQFLRTRHGVGDGGDKSRISNQQVFMAAAMRKVQSAETLSDPVKVYGLAKAAIDNMTLSSNMKSVQFMQAVAGTIKDIDLDRITFVQYPTSTHPYEESRLTPDYVNAAALFEAIESGEEFDVEDRGLSAVDSDVEIDPVTGLPIEEPTEEPTEPEAPREIDPATGLEIDPDTGWLIDPESGFPIDPESGLPVDPATLETGDDSEKEPSGPVKLPNTTGQKASDETCSSGRTIF